MKSLRLTKANKIAAIFWAILIFIPLLLPDSQYEQSLLIVCFLFAIMASGWNILSGLAGYVSLGHSVFLGIGMYTGAILGRETGVFTFYFAPVGMLAAMAFAFLLGSITLRTRSHAFVIITIAILLSVQLLATNWVELTGGSNGIIFRSPSWARTAGNTPYYYMFLVVLILTVFLVRFIMNARLGAGFVSIRDDESKAASIGINTTQYKVIAYCLSAAPYGLAGAIYSQYLGFLNPTGSFSILISVYLVLAALVGGKGTLWGPVFGGFFIALANEASTVFSGGISARVLIMGVVLVLTVMFVPQGLLVSVGTMIKKRLAKDKTVEFINQAAIAERDAPLNLSNVKRTPSASNADSSESILQVTDVYKSFGGVKAVNGVTMDVKRGSITGLIGPNGSGKTTLFNCITGTYGADSGIVVFNGTDITKMQPWTRAHLGMGRTFQITKLFKSMSVLDNLVAPLEKPSARNMLANRMQGEEVERAREILDFMGLSSFEKSNVSALSFGQQKLVEFAQILMLRPDIVMLDEPASGINPTLIERLSKAIKKLNEAGTTFLIVEHNIPLVLELCDYIHVLSAGEIMVSGTPEEVRNNEAVIEAYLGPDTLLEGLDV